MKKRESREETPPIQSLDRGLLIVETVAHSTEPVSLAELTSLLEIDRSSVFRLANTLRRRGFLSYSADRKVYTLGPAVWRLYHEYDWGAMLIRVSRDYVKWLSAETEETVHLAIRKGKQALFIDHAVTKHAIAVSGQTGELVPLHCTAHGQALLANCEKDDLETILGSDMLEAYTKQTIVSVNELAKTCAQIRERGYATDDGEYQDGLRCVASPIRAVGGLIIGSIGISVPLRRFPKDRYPICGEQVSTAAGRISERLSNEAHT